MTASEPQKPTNRTEASSFSDNSLREFGQDLRRQYLHLAEISNEAFLGLSKQLILAATALIGIEQFARYGGSAGEVFLRIFLVGSILAGIGAGYVYYDIHKRSAELALQSQEEIVRALPQAYKRYSTGLETIKKRDTATVWFVVQVLFFGASILLAFVRDIPILN